MSYASINGERIIAARITIPFYGAWVADVTLATGAAFESATIVVGDLTLVGAAYRFGDFAGSRSARIVGGFGGWRRDARRKSYFAPFNTLPLSLVLRDVATEVGESVSVDSDVMIGDFFVRQEGPASRVLRQLAGNWYIRPDGVTRVGSRPSDAIRTDFTVVSSASGKGVFQIATEALSDWAPGRRFSSPTVPTARTIGSVTHVLDNDGTVRTEVLEA